MSAILASRVGYSLVCDSRAHRKALSVRGLGQGDWVQEKYLSHGLLPSHLASLTIP
jgi:hypothetical protein